jgi:hypothetical protein
MSSPTEGDVIRYWAIQLEFFASGSAREITVRGGVA